MIDVGMCHEHSRVYEGLCKNCEVLHQHHISVICPSCVLFGKHKKHDIVSLREGAMYIRNEIDNQMFKGILKKEYCETHVLEIREYCLQMEKYKAETVKKIEDLFKGLITALKQRKSQLINEILEKFIAEKEKINVAEEQWSEKQEISQRLSGILKEANNSNVLVNSKFIMEGLRRLNEKLQFNELQVFNDIDTSLVIEDRKDEEGNTYPRCEIDLEQIIEALQNFLSLGEPNVLEYKS